MNVDIIDEVEYRKELLELERRYNDRIGKYIRLFLTIMGSFILIIGLLMTVLKIWS
ncbi:MAG: hypothetical protein LBR15_10685 [Methanobrevibacter sp.]|jgi:hypothetical protein|nr:hypothetical protein [Candidatus Methanovirga australis]